LAIWDERLPGESIKAWAAFTIYRDLGTAGRSITAAWRKSTKRKRGEAPGRWDLWSRTFRWVERSAAYDGHLDDLQRAAREKRLIQLAARRADYEFEVQDLTEELVGVLRAAVKQHDGAPITDVERIEDKEVTVDDSGGIRVVNVRTRIKGIKTSGLARLSDAYRDAMKQAVVGVREAAKDEKPPMPAKTPLPEFMKQALEKATTERETKSDGTDDEGKP
jgi:hypothetical protein